MVVHLKAATIAPSLCGVYKLHHPEDGMLYRKSRAKDRYPVFGLLSTFIDSHIHGIFPNIGQVERCDGTVG